MKLKQETEIFKKIITDIIKDHQDEINAGSTTTMVQFAMTLSNGKVDLNKLKPKEQQTKKKEIIDVKYFRISKLLIRTTFRTPLIDEFIPGFIYQKLDSKNKVWQEIEYSEDLSKLAIETGLKENKIRVEEWNKTSSDDMIFNYGYPINKEESEEQMENNIYRHVLYSLIAAGVEYFSALQQHKKEVEEQKNKPSNIKVTKKMPEPLSKEDKKYADWVKKERSKLGIKD